MSYELTRFRKGGGPLTKRISLAADGSLVADGSACRMAHGEARRFEFDDMAQFAAAVGAMRSDEALALGRLRSDLPSPVRITTHRRRANGAVARTSATIGYRRGAPALALLDHDRKGMPPEVDGRLLELGGFWPALLRVLPELEHVARVERASTSAGLYRTDTGEKLRGGNRHVFVAIADGEDADRFLKTLHERCWLAGLGWYMVGEGGQLLGRSIVDRMVGAPERLVFEGPPVLAPPLAQDEMARRPAVAGVAVLDTRLACPPLTLFEQAELGRAQAPEKLRLAGEAREARAAHVERVVKSGVAPATAERQCDGVLRPGVVLPFDDPELAGVTVAAVLADPAQFDGETLADPLEGAAYGTCKAKVLLRQDGTPWIHSFAHGRTVYELRYDAAALRAAIEAAPQDQATAVFLRLIAATDLNEVEEDALRKLVRARDGAGLTALKGDTKRARQEQARRDAQARRGRRADSRPRLPGPPPPEGEQERLPTISAVDQTSAGQELPMRNIQKCPHGAVLRSPPGLRLLTAATKEEEKKS